MRINCTTTHNAQTTHHRPVQRAHLAPPLQNTDSGQVQSNHKYCNKFEIWTLKN